MSIINVKTIREELSSALSGYDPYEKMEIAIYGTEDMSETWFLGGRGLTRKAEITFLNQPVSFPMIKQRLGVLS